MRSMVQNEDRRVDEMLQDARWPQDGDDDDDDAKMFYPRVQDVLHFGWIRASR